MYKVVLVDDERIVLTGIQKVYHLEEFGFTVAGAFTDASEALSRLKELSPQLIITDMKMPHMSGIEFIAQAREIVPDAEFVVLSGHDDFVFAQESLKLGVADYLLKPVRRDAFTQMLEKMNLRIREKLDHQDYNSRVETWLKENTGDLTNKFFVDLSENDRFDESLYQILEKQHGNNIRQSRFLLVRVYLRSLRAGGDYLSNLEEMAGEISGLLSAYGRVQRFMTDDVLSFLLYAEKEESGGWRTSDFADPAWQSGEPQIAEDGRKRLMQSVRMYIRRRNENGDSLTVGFSRVHEGLKQLFLARNECIRHIFLEDSELEIGAEERELGREDVDGKLPFLEIEQLFSEALTGNEDGIAAAVSRAYEPAISGNLSGVRDFAGMITFLILLRVYQTQERVDASLDLVDRSLLGIRQIEHSYPTLESQIRLSEKVLKELAAAAGKQGSGSGKKIIQEALDYIEQHYCENISLMDVAEAVSISKNYLANLFKKELDITLINYVTNLRIEEAKRLLRKGDLKMYEIADAVGYKDYSYFSQLFKKHTGVTLSAYKSRA